MRWRRFGIALLLLPSLSGCGEDSYAFNEEALRAHVRSVGARDNPQALDKLVETVRGVCTGPEESRQFAVAIDADQGSGNLREYLHIACPEQVPG